MTRSLSSEVAYAGALVELRAATRRYNVGRPNEVEVLHGIDLVLEPGEMTALIGPSGSGKSTLLNALGLLERLSSGSYRLCGEETTALDDAALTRLRRRSLGFVFQFHHLLPAFSALENVMLPALMQTGREDAAARDHALALLEAVGLKHAARLRPAELSGGMQQRVAIARSMMLRPPLVLADEPTGNLDTKTGDEVFGLLRKVRQEQGTSFLVVTHDLRLAQRCDRIVELVDGHIVRDAAQPEPGAGQR